LQVHQRIIVVKQHMQSANGVIHQRYTMLPVDSTQTFIYYDVVVDNLTLVVTMWLTLLLCYWHLGATNLEVSLVQNAVYTIFTHDIMEMQLTVL